MLASAEELLKIQMKLHWLAPWYAARFLTGHGPVRVRSPGVGDPLFSGMATLCFAILAPEH